MRIAWVDRHRDLAPALAHEQDGNVWRTRKPSEPRGQPALSSNSVLVDRALFAGGLERARRDVHLLVEGATRAELQQRSDGTRWTNQQLLFHMVFGFLIVRRLLPLVRLLGRSPAPVGVAWARLLGAGRRPFHVVNYWGSCGGALVFRGDRLAWLADRTIGHLAASLANEQEDSLRRGMPFPMSWDPYFKPFMTLAGLRVPGPASRTPPGPAHPDLGALRAS